VSVSKTKYFQYQNRQETEKNFLWKHSWIKPTLGNFCIEMLLLLFKKNLGNNYCFTARSFSSNETIPLKSQF